VAKNRQIKGTDLRIAQVRPQEIISRVSEESKGTTRSGRRWGRRVFLLVLLSVASLGVYLWSERVVLAEEQIRLALQQVGLDAFDLEVSDVGLSAARLQSFQIGDPAQPMLVVQDIRVRYSILGLWGRQISSVEIGALSLNLSADDRGLNLDPLAPLLVGGGGSGIATGPVSIADMDVTLDLPQGVIHLTTGGVIEQAGTAYRIALADECVKVDLTSLNLGGVVLDPISTEVCSTSMDGDFLWPPKPALALRTGPLPLVLRSELGDVLLDAAISGIQSEISVGALLGLRLRTKGAQLTLPGQYVSLSDGDMEVEFSDLVSLAGTWRLTGGRVNDLNRPGRFAPLRVAGDGTVSAEEVAFDLLLSDAASLTLLASAVGAHQLAKGQGQATIVAGPLIFSKTGLQPQQLLPTFKGLFANVVGSTNATAALRWGQGDLRGTANVRLDDMGLSTEAARIEGVSGDLVFVSLFPPVTAPGLQLDVGSVDAGVVLTDGTVAFGLDAQGRVTIEKASWPFAGGIIILTSGAIKPGAPEQAFELAVEKVDLSAFISLLALDDASGTGIISGRIPVVIRDGSPIITGGVLTASEPGHLSYKGGGTDAVGDGQGAIVFQALEDFQYTGLTLSFDGDAQDRLTVKLNLQGANPDLYDGYPFAININTEASFAELLRSATLGTNAIDLIRGRGATGQ
jgi:Dicarboxylate transport